MPSIFLLLYQRNPILQFGLIATNGQEQGQDKEVEPGPLSPFHSIPCGNLFLPQIPRSCLMVLLSMACLPVVVSCGRQVLWRSSSPQQSPPVFPSFLTKLIGS